MLQNLCSQIHGVKATLNNAFIDRSEEIDMLLTTLIANENICLVGIPGVAKSALIESLASLINGKYFGYQIRCDTTPDDIVGHISIKELRDNDSRKIRTANMAPEADVVYLDECFKASGPMLNSMLLMLNERMVDIGEGVRQKSNIKMIVASSNEYPLEGELGAFWDRWTVRMEIGNFKRDTDFSKFWEGFGNGDIGKVDMSKSIPIETVNKLRSMVWDVDSSHLNRQIYDLRTELMKEDILLTPRRWGKIKKMVHASALYAGRTKASKSDLKVLSHCAWRTVDEKETIDDIILQIMGGDIHDANRLWAMATKAYTVSGVRNLPAEPQYIGKTAPVLSQLREYVAEAQKLDQSEPMVAEKTRKIVEMADLLAAFINECLGM